MPQLALSQIRLDQRAQPRAALNTDMTTEYAEAMKAGAQFPPLTVFHDGKVYWLADGFHRHYAATSIGARDIACIVKQGGVREATLHACQANAVHGLRRSDEDKRRAVQTLLADQEWSAWSDREVARRCQVSRELVSKIRSSLAAPASESRAYVNRHGSVSTMKTTAIAEANAGRASVSEVAADVLRKVNGSHLDNGVYLDALKKLSHDDQRAKVERDMLADERRHERRHAIRSVPAPLNDDGEGAASIEPEDGPPVHLAITVLARSISDAKGTAEAIVAACVDYEELADLVEACSAAIEKLTAIDTALRALPRREAA